MSYNSERSETTNTTTTAENTADTRRPRRAGFGTTMRVLGAVVAGGVVVTGAAACAPENVKAEPSVSASADPTESAEPTPTTTPEATPTQTPETYNEASYTFGIPKTEADRLMAIDGATFESAIPVEEAAQFALYYVDQSNFIEDAKLYAEVAERRNGSTRDTLPLELSPNNSPQEILAVVAALDRVPFSIQDPANPANFDQTVAHRYVGSMVMDKDSPHANKLVTNIGELVQHDGGTIWDARALAVNGFFATPEVVEATPVTPNEQGRPSTTITFKVESGNTYTETYEWVTVGDKGIWLPK